MSQEIKRENRPEVEEWKGEKSKKRLKVSTEATAHIKEHYRQQKERAAQGEPVIWTYTRLPWALFNTMGVIQVDTIHYSALISAKQMSRYYLDRLNADGYFRDLCRYCTVPLGYALDHKPEIAPWGGLPRPTALVGAHCDDPSMKIWEVFAHEYNVPLFEVERTYMSRMPVTDWWWEDVRQADAEVESHRIELMTQEYRELIRFLETVTGKTYNESELRASVERYNRQSEYYWQATDLACRTKPCPIGDTDALANVTALRHFRGTQWGVDNARKYYEQIKEKVDNGDAALENERVRLMWVGNPIWYTVGFYNHWEESYGALFLPTNYMYGQENGIRRDVSDPVRALASHDTTDFLGMIPTTKSQWLVHAADRFMVNGIIFLVVESCKLLYTGILFARNALERAGVPTLEINADMVDARDWDDTKMKSLVTSYVETLMA